MFTTTSFESRLASVENALKESTRKPPTPSDRAPKIHQNSRQKSNHCIDLGFTEKNKLTDKEASALHLWKSMIMMLGSFIERSPQSQQWKRSELREFINQVEICLELKPGKLTVKQYGNLMTKLDDIARFKDGDLTPDLESLDRIVAAYGHKLAAE